MAKIHALSEDIIGKIAAGEVVERPAAAIKEMVENSLDAGATQVTVELREDPTDYIRVTDNGSGIDEGDIRLAFERHATSKIARENDLDAIATLGFRGEALASIAAVARVTLTTRTKERETGIRVKNEGGQITEIAEAACPVGTTILVRDLFYNTPVRRQFLKRASTELGAVSDLLAHLILSRPDVAFRLILAGKTVYQSPGDGQLASAVMTVYGVQALRQMRLVRGNARGVVLEGYVGIGELARSTRSGEHFFINQRMMRSLALSAAVENGCRERVMIGKFPVCALHLTLPYEAVNVNVHPNKLEVRFRDEAGVTEAVTELVMEALREKDAFEKPVEMQLQTKKEQQELPPAVIPPKIVPAAEVSRGTSVPPVTLPEAGAEKPEPVFREIPARQEQAEQKSFASTKDMPSPSGEKKAGESEYAPAPQPAQKAMAVQLPDSARSSAPVQVPLFREENAEQVGGILESVPKPMKIFGAAFDTFILVEYEDNLLLVDQHAVHERLLFDQMMRTYAQPAVGQELLVPRVVSLTKREQMTVMENQEALAGIGLTLEPFGDAEMAIRTLPVLLGETQTVDFLHEVLAELENGRDPTFEKKRTAILQSACKHAVKGGEHLTEEQLRSLVEEMIDRKVTPTCPHGRPLVVQISHRELDKKFKRIQS